MARNLEDAEDISYRTPGQWGNKYLAVAQYHNIYSGLLSAVPTSTDKVIEISFDGGAGIGSYTIASVLVDMTMYVGSAGSAVGSYDLGMVRIRKTPSESGGVGTFYIGETSDIEWENNAVLTIVDDYQIKAKHIRMTGGVAFIDAVIPYNDQQHTVFDPVPVLGPHHAVWLDDTDEGEKITNGTFTTVTTGWTAGAGALLTIVSNALHINRNGGGVVDHAYQTITTKVGKTYLLSVDVKSYTHGYEVYADGNLLFDDAEGTGVTTDQFIATATTTVIAFRAVDNASATLDVDDVTVNQVPLASVVLGPGADTASWVLGSTIASVSWSCVGAVSITSTGSVNPTIVFNAAGTYLAYCTVTATAGSTTAWGVRYVMVYDRNNPPITDFEIKGRSASYSEGGWTCEIQVNSGAGATVIREHALAVLFSHNYNNGVRFTRPGPIAGAEDIDFVGYIAQHDMRRDYDKGTASFTMEGAAELMKQETGTVCTLELVLTPTKWTQMPSLTVTRFAWHFLYWRTTAMRVMDVTLPPDELYDVLFNSVQNNLWAQIKEISEAKLFATPGVDSYGRFWLEIDPQMVSLADRTWPVVQVLAEQDWQGELEWGKKTKPQTGVLASAGIAVNSSGVSVTFYSLSPGHIPHVFGGVDEIMDNLPLVADQAASNELCGLLAGWRNNPYEDFKINFVSDYRAADLWPRQFFSMTILTADDPRGLGYSGNLIPRGLAFEHANQTGYEYLVMTAEAEAFTQTAINGDIPDSTGDDLDLPELDPVEITVDPIVNLVGPPSRVLVHDTTQGFLYTDNFNADPSTDIVWKQSNWGLQATDYLGIVPIYRQMNRLHFLSRGGVIVAAEMLGQHPTTFGIWYASSPLSNYTQILTRQEAADLWAAMPVDLSITPNYQLGVVGYGGGKILVNINNGGGFGNGTLLMGDTGGTFAVTDNTRDYHIGKGISYGGGAWVETTGAGVKNLKALTPLGVESAEYTLADDYRHTRIGSGSSLYAWISFGGAGDVIYVQGNGATIGASVDPGAPVNNLATSASGSVTMAVVGSGVKKSTDYGSSWSAAITFPLSTINVARNVFCVDSLRWIVTGSSVSAAYSPIVYSGDGGTTWAPKYGNLGSLFPSTSFYFDLVKALP